MLWQDGLTKKVALEYDLSLFYKKKWHFLFPKIWSCSLDEKRKMIFLKKNTWKYDIFFKCPEKMVFPKKSHWNMIFLVLSEKMVFFFQKIWYFFFGRKMKDDFSQEIHGNMIFSVYMYKYYKYDITLLQKNSKMIFSRKNTVKDDSMKNLQYSVPFSPQELHLGVCLSAN